MMDLDPDVPVCRDKTDRVPAGLLLESWELLQVRWEIPTFYRKKLFVPKYYNLEFL